jgi:FkbM family methyltransferase
MEKLIEIINANPSDHSLAQNLIGSSMVAAYGFGQGFITFKEFVVDKIGLKLDFIIDRKFSTPTFINDVKATDLDYFNNVDCSNVTVVITVGNRKTQETIRSELMKKGFRTILTAFDFYEYHLSHASRDVTYAGNEYYRAQESRIMSAYNVLQDNESRNVFKQILSIYVTRRIERITCRDISEQYISSDIPFKKGFRDWINFGAYDGDTVRNVSRKYGPFNSLVCIEPDLGNFARLANYLAQDGGGIARYVLVIPMACGEMTEYKDFSLNGTNSSIAPPLPQENRGVKPTAPSKVSFSNNNQPVLVCRFDQVLVRRNVDLINMDIEGAELGAIRGLKNLIKDQIPDLAISIYHEPAHLWEIILLIESFELGYRFFIRNYTGYPAETVLYACAQN